MTNAEKRRASCHPDQTIGLAAAPRHAPLAQRQAQFAQALLDPACPLPPGLVGPDGRPSLKRLNVYRNNVVAGLTEALRDGFPAVARIVGDEFFAAMARIHVAARPPRSPVMLDYGEDFADFIAGFEPASLALPYLRDVARLERAWLQAYHAAEAQPLPAQALAAYTADDLMQLRVALHPSLRVVRSAFPVLTLWQTNIAGGVPAAVDLDAGGQDVLLNRPDAEVELRLLPPGGAAFIEALGEGRGALDAMAQALAADERFDLAANLSGLVDAGAIVGLQPA